MGDKNRLQRRLRGGAALAWAAALMGPLAARAQSVPPPADQAAAQPQIEEVVVTARKRAENLLSTPVSVTAFTAQDLQARDIKSLNDVATFTPGLNLNNGLSSSNDRSTQTFVLRGLNPVDTTASTTTVFIDGAPILAGFASGVDDLARVEVLKGPQTAYFGRQTFAGAINLVTRDPGDAFGGTVEGKVGSDNLTDFRAAVEGAIVPGKLTARLSVREFQTDGQYQNASSPGYTFGDQSTKNVSLTLVAKPTEDLKIKIFGIYFDDNDGPTTVGKFNRPLYNCNAGAAPGGKFNYYCGSLPDEFPSNLIGNNTVVDAGFLSKGIGNSTNAWHPIFSDSLGLEHGGLIRNAWHGNINIDYTIPGTKLTLSSLTAGDINHVANLTDYGNAPDTQANRLLVLKHQLNDDVSQEFRLTSDPEGRLKWSIGFDYQYTRNIISTLGQLSGSYLNFFSPNPSETTTLAGFGSLSYDFTPHITLNFEGRYQSDKREVFKRTYTGSNYQDASFLDSTTDDFLPRVILQYKFKPDVQVYATYAQATNPGEFNSQFIGAPAAELQYLKTTYGVGTDVSTTPEHLDYYEVGFKGRFWNGRAQVVADAYYGDWTDQLISQQLVVPVYNAAGQPTAQVTTITPYTNLGHTILSGVEAEIVLAPMRGLVLNASGAINDTNIRSTAFAAGTALTGKTNFKGNQLPNASKYNAILGAEYTHPLTNGIDGFGRVDYIYKSGLWDSVANLAQTGDTNIVNLRAGVRNGHIVFEGYVENVFNDRAYTSIESNVDVLSPGFADRTINVGLPVLRSYGARVRYDF